MAELAFRVVIPARYGSSRLPGKPLLPISGRPMIEHVWLRAKESGAATVLVATDDQRIAAAVHAFGGEAMLTSAAHPSGTDRLAEVVTRAGWADDDIVVNLQGDEPQLPGRLLVQLASALAARPSAAAATMAGPVHAAAELWNPNVVKVVLDGKGFALYFSRAPVPWVRGLFVHGQPAAELPTLVPFYRHFGLYAYRVRTLKALAAAQPSALESAESLEQLRMLHHGMQIHVTVLDELLPHGVDTPDDLLRVQALLAGSDRH